MMKKKLIWIIVAAILLLGGIAAAVLLWPADEQAESQELILYWNVDRDSYKVTYKDAHSPRTPREDGMYYIRLAAKGEQKEYPVKDQLLVDMIDNNRVMALEFDENGVIVGVQKLTECTGGVAAQDYYVGAIDGNEITVLISNDPDGAQYKLTLDEDTKIYNMGAGDILSGLPATLQVDDQILAIWNKDRTRITHVYTSPYNPPADMYWNVKRYYDATTKQSTREISPTGGYEFDMYLNGEPITVKTMDQKVANAIDGRNPRWMGLRFDEEGLVTSVVSPTATAGGGGLQGTASGMITSLENGKLVLQHASGAESTAFISQHCKVIDGTNTGNGSGTSTDLRVGDMVYSLKDNRGRAVYVLVIGGRTSGNKMYWNVDRQWNKTTQSTNRKPDENGWYYFKMAVGGKHVTVRTDNSTFANAIERPVCCALELEGDVVTDVPGSDTVYGGSVFASWYYVDSIENGTLTASYKGQTVSAPLAKDFEMYDTSSNAVLEGEITDYVSYGDTIHCFKNFKGEVSLVYVVGRKLYMHAYWNSSKGTERIPDADGWYHIEMTSEGKPVTVKTKDEAIVKDIDGRSMMLLGVNKGEVLSVYTITKGAYTSGGLWATFYKITNIEGSRITASNGSKTLSVNVSSNAGIYDVSPLAGTVGEPTKLKVGDTIHSVKNSSGKLSLVYVTARALPSQDFYCQHCDQTVSFTGWDGGSNITQSGHYYLPFDVNTGSHRSVGVDSEKLDVVLNLNGYTYNCSRRAFLFQKGTTFSVMDSQGGGVLMGSGEPNEKTHSGVVAIIDSTFNLYSGTIQTNEKHKPILKGGAITVSGTMNMYGGEVIGCTVEGGGGGAIIVSVGKTFNMYGGTVSGGSVNAEVTCGGNICVDGTMNMYGGTVTGGKTMTNLSHGGNIYVAGAFNMEGGTVTGGSSAVHGGNIYIKGTANLLGGTISGGTAKSGKGHDVINLDGKVNIGSVKLGKFWLAGLKSNGDVTVSGAPTIDEFNMAGCTKTFLLEGLTGGSISIAIADGAKDRTIATGCTDADLAYIKSLEKDEPVCKDGKLSLGGSSDEPIVVGHAHCFCAGAEVRPEGHVCVKTNVFQPITATKTISESGYYFLDWSGLKAAALTIDAKDVHLCLNGANIRAQTTITMKAGASLTICDCVGTGVIMTTKNTPLTVIGGTEVTLFGGTLTGTYAPTTSRVSLKINGGAIFNMYGGVIKDGCSVTTATYVDKDTYGGNVQIGGSGIFNLYGGEITGGKTGKYGGNVSVFGETAVFNMYGGKVTNGTAGTHGGNIAVAMGSINIYGGTITGGSCTMEGSNISVRNDGKALITEGTVDMNTFFIAIPGNLTVKPKDE